MACRLLDCLMVRHGTHQIYWCPRLAGFCGSPRLLNSLVVINENDCVINKLTIFFKSTAVHLVGG